jgi:N-acetylglucosamine-6-phosphate deacetylase
MDDCVRNMVRSVLVSDDSLFTSISLVQVSAVGPSQTASVISASSAAPAVLLGLRPHADNDEDRLHVLGSLAPGAWADFLLVDAQLRVKETWLAGRRVWAAAADDGASTLSGVTGSGSASAVADGVGSAPSALATAQPG